MTDRDRQLRDDLTRIAEVYRRWVDDLATIPARSLTGSRNGKPTSRPPAGLERDLRAALTDVGRLCSDAHHLAGRNWPSLPTRRATLGVRMRWRTLPVPWTTLDRCGHRTRCNDSRCVGDPVRHLCGVSCDCTVRLGVHDRPYAVWIPDGDDGSLSILDVGVMRRGLLALEALVNQRIDPVRGDMLSCVGRMKRRLDRAGVWERPEAVVMALCAHCLERRPVKGSEWCWWCQRAHETGASCAVCGYAA